MIRSFLVLLTLFVMTILLGGAVIVAAILGLEDKEGSVYDWAPRLWTRSILWVAGVRVHLHNAERMPKGEARVYVSNHVSWFDVFTLASVLPHYKWIAKAELGRIPIFGAAARAAGMIFIERENRKAAFAQYEVAAERIRGGVSVIVCPEGTRGSTYALRPFKKGPFVLAIAAGVPVVPTIVYGTIAIFPRGSWIVRSGDVHVHFLEPVSMSGFDYDDRDRLSRVTWERMAEAFEREYGVVSAPPPREREFAAES